MQLSVSVFNRCWLFLFFEREPRPRFGYRPLAYLNETSCFTYILSQATEQDVKLTSENINKK